MRATELFYTLLKETLGVEPVDGRGAAGVVPGAARVDSRIVEAAYGAVPELQLLETSEDAAEATRQLREFEARLRARSRGQSMESVTKGVGLAWSRDAVTLQQLMRTEKPTGGPSAFARVCDLSRVCARAWSVLACGMS
jgi:hypothetical protein